MSDGPYKIVHDTSDDTYTVQGPELVAALWVGDIEKPHAEQQCLWLNGAYAAGRASAIADAAELRARLDGMALAMNRRDAEIERLKAECRRLEIVNLLSPKPDDDGGSSFAADWAGV